MAQVTIEVNPSRFDRKIAELAKTNAELARDEAISAKHEAEKLALQDFTGIMNLADIKVKGPWVDVRAFGAKGDGVIDDTEAIQNAIDYAYTSGLGIIYLPAGSYVVTSTLDLKYNVYLFGAGQIVSKLIKKNFAGPLLHVNRDGITNGIKNEHIIIEGIQLDGLQSRSYEGGAIVVEYSPKIVFRDVRITQFNGNGIEFRGICYYPKLINVFIDYCTNKTTSPYSYQIGETLPGTYLTAGLPGNNLRCAVVDFPEDGLTTRVGDFSKASADLYVYGCNFESNDVGINWKSGDSHIVCSVMQGNTLHDVIALTTMKFTECHFEMADLGTRIRANYSVLVDNGATTSCFNCNFWGNNSAGSLAAIRVINGQYVTLVGCSVNGFQYGCDVSTGTLTSLYIFASPFIYSTYSFTAKGIVNGTPGNATIFNHNFAGAYINGNLMLGINGVIRNDEAGEISIYNPLVPTADNGGSIGKSTKKFANGYINQLTTNKIILAGSVTIDYGTSSPEGSVTANIGSFYFTNTGIMYYKQSGYSNTGWLPMACIRSGITSARPTTGLTAGLQFFDTTLGKPIWYNGSAWIDSAGITV